MNNLAGHRKLHAWHFCCSFTFLNKSPGVFPEMRQRFPYGLLSRRESGGFLQDVVPFGRISGRASDLNLFLRVRPPEVHLPQSLQPGPVLSPLIHRPVLLWKPSQLAGPGGH